MHVNVHQFFALLFERFLLSNNPCFAQIARPEIACHIITKTKQKKKKLVPPCNGFRPCWCPRPLTPGLPHLKIVSMIRKYHNHKPQTTPWHREEEPLNHHETPGRQIKQIIQRPMILVSIIHLHAISLLYILENLISIFINIKPNFGDTGTNG